MQCAHLLSMLFTESNALDHDLSWRWIMAGQSVTRTPGEALVWAWEAYHAAALCGRDVPCQPLHKVSSLPTLKVPPLALWRVAAPSFGLIVAHCALPTICTDYALCCTSCARVRQEKALAGPPQL